MNRGAPGPCLQNSGVWVSIIFTRDMAGARLGWGWPSQLTNDQSDFFPGHPSFNYCEGRDRASREYDTASLLVSHTIIGAHNQRIFNQATVKWIVRNTTWRLLDTSIMSCPKMRPDFTNWNANNSEWHTQSSIHQAGGWLWWIRPILQSI